MVDKRWEVLAVTERSDKEFYMELCDGFVCHTVRISRRDAAYLSHHLSSGANIYATDLRGKDEGSRGDD